MTRAATWCAALAVLSAAPLSAQEPEAPPEPADEAATTAATPSAAPVMSDALRAEIDRMVDEKLQAKLADLPAVAPVTEPAPPVSFTLKGDFFTKLLLRNNTSGGCVSYGNPAPEGDNFAGDNGICSELGITLTGRVSDRVEAGARLQTRFGAEWADWYENGDEADSADGSGESLGQNHAAYLQLRGVYLRIAPPIPTIRSVHVGATDLGMYNPWTIGKARYTERDNARAALLDGSFGAPFSYTLGVIALPKLYAGPGYTTGIADPLIDNPFWQRDFAWAAKLKHENDWVALEHISSAVIDEEADLDDPDAVGSTNAVDPRDGAVVTNLRYVNTNHTLEAKSNAIDWLGLSALVGYSYSRTDDALVFNSVTGAQGFTPVPMGEHHGYAAVARVDLFDPADIDLDLQLEYFNIGTDWVAVMGTRREADVLLTDGFVDGQVPTLNVANEFQDFTEAFYEPVIGWHGTTAVLTWRPGALELAGEGTFIEYNTDTGAGSLDTDKTYPDFLSTDGMTDTDLFTFANTNDRGRDPRSVYHEHQNRRTVITMVKGAYTLDVLKTVVLRAKSKFIYDTDQRDQSIEEADNYTGLLFFNKASVEAPITDEFSAAVGYGLDAWFEEHRSGEVIAGVADYPNYVTVKHKVFTDLRYSFGGANLWLHAEYLNKDLDASDNRLDQRGLGVVRAIGTVSASF